MSGFFGGYFFRDGQKDLNPLIDAMREPLLVHQDCDSDTRSIGHRLFIGVTRTNCEASPYISQADDNGMIALFNGVLYNRAELAARAGLENKRGNEGNILAALFEKDGADCLNSFSGMFSFVLVDATAKRLIIGADRCGFEYVYYYADNEKLLFGSRVNSIANLTRSQLEFDLHSVCDIHNYHAIFNQRTIFKQIQLMPPGSFGTVCHDKVKIHRYWQFPTDVELSISSEPELLGEAKILIQEAVKQSTLDVNEPGIMLSGGLDSRLLAAVLSRESPSAKALSVQWAAAKSNDNRLAEKIANALSLDFHYFETNATAPINLLQDNIRLSDGVWGFYELLPFFRLFKEKFPNLILLNGFLMDTLFRSAWAFFPNREGAQLSVDGIVKRYVLSKEYQTKMVFDRDFLELLNTKRGETVESEVKGQPMDHPAEVSLRFYLHNRGRRAIGAHFTVLRQFVPIRFPAAVHRLFDFAIRLPYHLRSDTRFYRKLICDWFPEVGQIAWDRTGKPLNQEAWRLKPKYRKWRRQFGYVMQRATHGRCDILNLPHAFDKSFRRNGTFRNVLLEILYDRQTLSRGYVTRGGVDRLVQYELSGHDVGHIFKSILSVEMMHRTFGN
jgi:hypothetical protein